METRRSRWTRIKVLGTIGLLLAGADIASAAGATCAKANDMIPAIDGVKNAVAVASAAGASERAPSSSPSQVKGSMAKLEQAARYHSTRCRRSSTTFHGGRTMCGNVSKGMCNRGTMEILRDGLGLNIPMSNSFSGKKQIFGKYMQKLSVSSCDDAPKGAVCLYSTSRHSFGHSEVKTGIGYCSDFCSFRAANHSKRGKFTFYGAYIPK